MVQGTGLVSEKAEALYAELNERAEAAISSCSATGEVLQYIYYICTCGQESSEDPIKVLSL